MIIVNAAHDVYNRWHSSQYKHAKYTG